ncbi:MAG: M1 family aminopeptidase, partial [Candidatus Bathyarchaeia archaeon]
LTDRISRLQKGLLLGFSLPSVEGRSRLKVSTEGDTVNLVPTKATSLEDERQFYFELPESGRGQNGTTLECAFNGRLPEPRRDIFFLIGDWHPKIQSDKVTFDDYEVTATIPADQVLVSTGLGTRAESLADQRTRYELKAEKVRDFGLITSDHLGMIEDRATDVVVRSYYLSETERWGRPLLDFACDAINFYREEFGFYPQIKLSVMPGHREPTGGWPVTSNVVAIHDLDKSGDRAESFAHWIIAHEIGHQYWGGHVICSEFGPGLQVSWLDIGLGIYMDRCYMEARGFGMNYHRGRSGRYIQGLSEGVDTTVIQPPEKLRDAGFDYNNIVVHSKGYAIISMLEQILGKDLFRQIFNEALARFKHKDIRSRDFQLLCEELSGEDLDWFFYQWLHTNRYLSYRIASQEEKKQGELYYLKARVESMGDARMPIPVQATFQDGRKVILWTNRALRVTELVFTGSSPVQKLQLDPEGRFPIVYPPLDPVDIEVAKEVTSLPWLKSRRRAKEVYEKALQSGLRSVSLWFKLGLTLYDGEFYDEAFEAFKRTQELSSDVIYVFVATVWQGHVLDLLGKRDKALEYYQEAKQMRIEETIQHDQYGIIINEKWVEERLRSPFQRKG